MYSHFKGRGAFAGWRDDFLRAYIEHGAIEREDGSLELSTPPWVEGKLYEAMPDLTEWLKVEDCDVPVQAIYGERGGRISEGRDPLAPLRPMFPRIEMTIFPDCTHSGPMEHPELFEAAIRKKVAGIN
jgi:pimeloyl-ACP methyl ester carboxylesterase